MKIFVSALCGVLLMAGAALGEETIRIGVVSTVTGQNASSGQLLLAGIQLANKLYPEALGKKIELCIMDNKSDNMESATVTSILIERDKVNALIGPYASSSTMAAGEVAEVAGIPLMSAASTNILVTKGKKYVFRACFIDSFQGEAGANYIYNNLGCRKAAVLIDAASDYSVGLANFFKSKFAQLGGTIVSDLKYRSGDTDFSLQLAEIIAREPDVLFIPAYFSEGVIILKQARELGAAFRFMSSDSMDNPEIAASAGEAAEGFLYTTFAYDPSMPDMNQEAKVFTEAWKKEYADKVPVAEAAAGYDAYVLLHQAIVRAGRDDPKSIRDALEETKDAATVTGPTSFSAEIHDPIKDMGVIEIKNGQKTYIYTIKP
jgi:branched-chain amino acid transport system substrate-binding protein